MKNLLGLLITAFGGLILAQGLGIMDKKHRDAFMQSFMKTFNNK